MKQLLPVVLLVSVLAFAGVALAMEKPTINMPQAGDALGPNYDISGSMPYRAFLIVITDCLRTDTGEVVGSVPGIRHWTRMDGTFEFRCASPRVSMGPDIPLIYRIRCWETNGRSTGPEAVVECRMAN
jgi:hypothetical protein